MSRNEEESGTLKFSSRKAYLATKSKMLEAYRAQQEKDFNVLVQLAKDLKASKPKGARGFDWKSAFNKLFYAGAGDETPAYGSPSETGKLKALTYWKAWQTLMQDKVEIPSKFSAGGVRIEWKDRTSPRMPTKVSMEFVNKKTCSLDNSSCSVEFSDEDLTVSWTVPENNHACEHARGTFLGQLFFSTMKSAEWGRSGGGVIAGNDEYTRDNSRGQIGGGSNYTTASFGPAGKRETDFASKLKCASFFR